MEKSYDLVSVCSPSLCKGISSQLPSRSSVLLHGRKEGRTCMHRDL